MAKEEDQSEKAAEAIDQIAKLGIVKRTVAKFADMPLKDKVVAFGACCIGVPGAAAYTAYKFTKNKQELKRPEREEPTSIKQAIGRSAGDVAKAVGTVFLFGNAPNAVVLVAAKGARAAGLPVPNGVQASQLAKKALNVVRGAIGNAMNR